MTVVSMFYFGSYLNHELKVEKNHDRNIFLKSFLEGRPTFNNHSASSKGSNKHIGSISSSSSSIRFKRSSNTIKLHPKDKIYSRNWWEKPTVIEEYKLIFFSIPKVASTEWKLLFRRMMGWSYEPKIGVERVAKYQNPNINGLLTLDQYPLEVAQEMMNSPNWTRAIFVREPKERLVSAYLDKFIKRNHTNSHFFQHCCQVGHILKTQQEQDHCIDMIYEQNFTYFLRRTLDCHDPHWDPQLPVVDEKWWKSMTFVGYMENLSSDAKLLLQYLKSSPPSSSSNNDTVTTMTTAWDKYGASGWGPNHDKSFLQRNMAEHITNSAYCICELYTQRDELFVEKHWHMEWNYPEYVKYPKQTLCSSYSYSSYQELFDRQRQCSKYSRRLSWWWTNKKRNWLLDKSHIAIDTTAISSIRSTINLVDKEDACRCCRRCPSQRINKIYFQHGWDSLANRVSIIFEISQLAGFLCATLELPPPRIHLDPKGNNDIKLDPKVQWNDFINLTFRQDLSPVIASPNDSLFEDGFNDWHNIPVYDGTKYPNWLHIVSQEREILKDYRKIQDFALLQKENATTGFLWEIRRSIFQTDLFDKLLPHPHWQIQQQSSTRYEGQMKPFLPSYRAIHQEKDDWGCRYTNKATEMEPLTMKLLQQRLRQMVLKQAAKSPSSPDSSIPIYGYFQLSSSKDGSEDKLCDTSVEALREYIRCSLAGTGTTGKRIVLLLESRGEEDRAYFQSLIDYVNSFAHVTGLDADTMTVNVVQKAIQEGLIDPVLDNNFYINKVQNVLRQSMSKIFLDRRPSMCSKCTPLMQRFSSAFGST